ncbi:hypothetical protein [Amycolatopsis sp. WGS_07]|uniref:hypothetical protein n=1 Tax=Amycolatopsis sp. WGS_07 TaxID=3076764 RepID=UPI0038735974
MTWLGAGMLATFDTVLLSMVNMRVGSKGVRLSNVYGWPGWIVDVRFPSAGRPATVTAIPPAGTRSNARRPTDDPELVARLVQAAHLEFGWLGFLAVALPSPHKKKRDGVRLRAETMAIMYESAKDQGLSPRRAISAIYGLPVIDQGERTLYSKKLLRWLHQARTTVNPATGKTYLPTPEEYAAAPDKPKRWPGSTGKRPLAPRRAAPMLSEPVREGRCAGQTLTLQVTRAALPSRLSRSGGRVVSADLTVEGRWSSGEHLELEPLREVSPDQAPHRVQALVRELEARFPGAKITAVVRNPS